MQIEIHTNNPAALWTKIKKDITAGEVKTWKVVLDANKTEYLTHTPEQWLNKALLIPSTAISPNRLILKITWWTTSVPNEYTKGLYIGRFTEELLEHYRNDFSKLETYA